MVPFAVRLMIDCGFSDGNSGLIHVYFGALIGVVAVLALASGSRYYLVMTLGERVVADLRGDLFAHLTRLDPSFFDAEKTGEIVSRLSADTTQLKATFGSSASIALRNFFMFFGAIALMVITSPKLSAYVLVAIPVIVLPLYAAGRRSARARASPRTRSPTRPPSPARASTAVRVMQAFVAERFTAARYRAAADDAYEAARAMTQSRAIVTVAALFLAFASVVVVLWLGAEDVIAGRMTGGALSQFLLFAVLGASAWASSRRSGARSPRRRARRRASAKFSRSRRASSRRRNPLALPSPARGEVAFHGVGFAYPGRGRRGRALRSDFRVAPGEVVAIVGPSGAGKSTLFQLIERFYDPTRGAITLDGVDIAKVDPKALRAEIALVPQDAFIFGASVADNIAYGAPGATPRRRSSKPRKRAAADGFVAALPEGYDTQLGERGVTLVGRRTPAPGDRARDPEERAGAVAGRGDLGARRGERDAGAERARRADEGAHDAGHRPSPGDDRQRRPHSGDGRRRHRRRGHAREPLAAGGLYARLARLQFEAGAAALAGEAAAAE